MVEKESKDRSGVVGRVSVLEIFFFVMLLETQKCARGTSPSI